jgi:hypothetical protein
MRKSKRYAYGAGAFAIASLLAPLRELSRNGQETKRPHGTEPSGAPARKDGVDVFGRQLSA